MKAKKSEKNFRNILLTFVGKSDPQNREDQKGPILSLVLDVAEKKINGETVFDAVILFPTKETESDGRTNKTKEALLNFGFKKNNVIIGNTYTKNPTEYLEILPFLLKEMDNIVETYPDSKLWIAIASGSPFFHASFLLILASERYNDAEIIYKIRPEYGGGFKIIDYKKSGFPIIRTYLEEFTAQTTLTDRDVEGAKKFGILTYGEETMRSTLARAKAFANSNEPILLLGERGTGKNLFARYIHSLSSRNNKSYIVKNCAAIPANLVESELFGAKKGAYTDLKHDLPGAFLLANDGTLFLDEVADLSAGAQPKLLTVLSEKKVTPLGAIYSTDTRSVNVRIISATNNLAALYERSSFRSELLGRLAVHKIVIPPLRQRKNDIPLIAEHILNKKINENSLRFDNKLSDKVKKELLKYHWPGNIRELGTVIKNGIYLAIAANRDAIDVKDLEFEKDEDNEVALQTDPKESLYLKTVATSKNVSEAARKLGRTPQAISQFVKRRKKKQEV